MVVLHHGMDVVTAPSCFIIAEPEDRPGVGTTENIFYEETEENDEDDSNPDDNYASTLTTVGPEDPIPIPS